ncbi:uncharacterized protein LOC143835127 [Paroedura picta]|uniref:uncharacterized protein LOC143835127 n=1 Tax=Paroedura picta TaxID=143630 RepID=UPI004057A242
MAAGQPAKETSVGFCFASRPVMKRKPCPLSVTAYILDNLQAYKYTVNDRRFIGNWSMETEVFTEQGSPRSDASKGRTSRITWCLGVCLVLWVLSLLPFLVACLLFHHKESPKPCWLHASYPVSSPPGINWTWTGNCSSSAMNASESSLEIRESGMYFAYVYVACNDTGFPSRSLFTVELATHSNEPLSVLKGPNVVRAFVNLGRPHFLDKGTRLHLKINKELKDIDIKRTYWGLLKI